jgi:hypothetical protein
MTKKSISKNNVGINLQEIRLQHLYLPCSSQALFLESFKTYLSNKKSILFLAGLLTYSVLHRLPTQLLSSFGHPLHKRGKKEKSFFGSGLSIVQNFIQFECLIE